MEKLLYCVAKQNIADEDKAVLAFILTEKSYNELADENCTLSWGQFDIDEDDYEPFSSVVRTTEITVEQAKFLKRVGAVGLEAGCIVFENDDIYIYDYFETSF